MVDHDPGARPLAYVRAATGYGRAGAEQHEMASLDRAQELLRLAQ